MVYGIRPEHLVLAEAGQRSVESEIAVVEPTGAETLLVSRVAGGEFQAVFRERHAFRPGTRVQLAPLLDKVHLFDAETGQRL